MQTLVALGALAMVMLFSLNMYRTTSTTQQRIVMDEVAMQMSAVGAEVLNYLETKGFDEAADSSVHGPYPASDATEFTDESSFGDATCAYTGNTNPCTYLEDFHTYDGTTRIRAAFPLQQQQGLITYDVDIHVRYVNPTTLAPTGGPESTAKEVVLTISHPSFRNAQNQVFEIEMSRVYVFGLNFGP